MDKAMSLGLAASHYLRWAHRWMLVSLTLCMLLEGAVSGYHHSDQSLPGHP